MPVNRSLQTLQTLSPFKGPKHPKQRLCKALRSARSAPGRFVAPEEALYTRRLVVVTRISSPRGQSGGRRECVERCEKPSSKIYVLLSGGFSFFVYFGQKAPVGPTKMPKHLKTCNPTPKEHRAERERENKSKSVHCYTPMH